MIAELDQFDGFEWDSGNKNKNLEKHQVTIAEIEQTFFNTPIVVANSSGQASERRWALLGQTNLDRSLTIVFTTRGSLIRVISARPMSKKERGVYEKYK